MVPGSDQVSAPQAHPNRPTEPRNDVAVPHGGIGPSRGPGGGATQSPTWALWLDQWLPNFRDPVIAGACTSLGLLTSHLSFLIHTMGLRKDLIRFKLE